MIFRDFQLAFRNISRQRRRSVTAISSIAFGITALILAGGFIDWNLWFGRESTIHSQLGHIRIVKPGFMDAGSANPHAYVLPDDPRMQSEIASMAHVEGLAQRLSFIGLASHGDATISFIGEGIAQNRNEMQAGAIVMQEGVALSAADPRGIIIGRGLAANLGVKTGDTIVLLVNTPNGSVRAAEATVKGLFATIAKAYDDAALRVPLSMAQELMQVGGVHFHEMVLDKTENTDSVLAALSTKYRDKKLEFIPWYQIADFYNKTAELFARQVAVIRIIIAAIIVLGISNTMMMSVMERTGEIGTAMALGTPRRKIRRLFLTEGFLLGAIGGLAGLVIAYAASTLISAVGIPMPPAPGMATGYRAEIMMTWRAAFEALLLAVATTLMASLYPAWKASRLVIVDALRHNR